MELIDYVYLGSFILGLGFAIISGLMSGVFSGGPETGGDVDVTGGHVQVDGHAVAAGDTVGLSPVSPVTIAMFVTSFGGAGILLHKVAGLPFLAHLPLSALSGFLVAGAVFMLFAKVLRATQASSHAGVEDVIGSEAEVLTAIPADGVGEIGYTARGSRLNAPAKTLDGKEVPARAIVKIVKVVGGMYFVEKPR